MNKSTSSISKQSTKSVSVNSNRKRIKSSSSKKSTLKEVGLSMTDDNLNKTFLEKATEEILAVNNQNSIPVIYAENGVIYKTQKTGRTALGKITPLTRKISENKYKIEPIRK